MSIAFFKKTGAISLRFSHYERFDFRGSIDRQENDDRS